MLHHDWFRRPCRLGIARQPELVSAPLQGLDEGRHASLVATGRQRDNLELVAHAAAEGLAVADVSNRTAQASLNDGSLVTALHDRRQRIPGLFLYHAGRRHVPPAPQALIEFI
jgi:DNA-binding transcriptional LysR family regulator